MDAVTIGGLLTQVVEPITTAVSSVWSIATGNPLMSFFVGLSILGAGIGFFTSIKHAV